MSDNRKIAIALRLDQPHPNHQDVFSGVQRYAHGHPEWTCVIDEHPGYQSAGGRSLHDDYDGVIARALPRTQQRLRRRGIPLVNTIYRYADPRVAGVYLDVHKCGRVAAEHLIERGFRRFACLDSGTYRQGRDIGRAFSATLTDRGLPCATRPLPAGEYDDHRHWQLMRSQIGQFLDTLAPPVGILADVPWIARLLTTICVHRGWYVPQHVALICVDDQKNVVELSPQITCIDCNYEQIGYESAALLDQIMTGQASPQTQRLIAPRGIITRDSTDYFAVEDEVVAQALRFIAKHLADQLTVERIAHQVAVSPRSLQRRFDKALGRSISHEVRRLRLETAKRLLRNRGMPISRIARQAGFSSSIIMAQVFKRELGMSATAYRKATLRH